MANSVTMPAGVMRPILLPVVSVNQRLPSGPSAMSNGVRPLPGSAKSVLWPAIVLLAIFSATGSVYHMLPSGPLMMPPVSAPPGAPYSENAPEGIAFPIPCCFVYQTLPSGPELMAVGPRLVTFTLYREKVAPSVVTAPNALGAVLWCRNQILPSGPAQIAPGELGVGTWNSVNVTSGPFTAMTGALITGTLDPEPPLPTVAIPTPLVPPALLPSL